MADGGKTPDTGLDISKVPAHVPRELIYQWQEEDYPEYSHDPYGVFQKVAEEAPPLFYTPEHQRSHNGAWVVTSSDYAREVLQKADPFCVSIRYASDDASWPRRLIPLMVDPPEHIKYRALIAPLFSPKAIDRMEENVRTVTNDLLDSFVARGECEFMNDFARTFPGTIFMSLMGLPLHMKEQFFAWEEKFFHGGTPDEKKQVGVEIAAYLAELVAEKRKNPTDDVVSMLTKAQVDGKPIEDEIVHDFCFLLYIAGLDTVNAALGHTWKYMAEHQEAQARLRDNPDLISGAVEEMLRYHSWVQVSRVLSRDYDFHGVQMKEGDRVVVHSTLASWDPDEFINPQTIDFSREPNPHFAFGGGAHRCAGSHLARRELRVALAEWLRRIPQWQITPGDEAVYFTDGMLSPRHLPLSWDKA